MGFRKDAYATVWDVDVKSDTMTKVRISVSKKDRVTGEYVQDWSGFVAFVGTANAKQAASLKPKDRIKLGDVDETSKYDSEKHATYFNHWCYSFEPLGKENTAKPNASDTSEPQPVVDEGVDDADRLPW